MIKPANSILAYISGIRVVARSFYVSFELASAFDNNVYGAVKLLRTFL